MSCKSLVYNAYCVLLPLTPDLSCKQGFFCVQRSLVCIVKKPCLQCKEALFLKHGNLLETENFVVCPRLHHTLRVCGAYDGVFNFVLVAYEPA